MDKFNKDTRTLDELTSELIPFDEILPDILKSLGHDNKAPSNIETLVLDNAQNQDSETLILKK